MFERNVWKNLGELAHFHDELGRVFASAGRETETTAPHISVWAGEDGAVVTAVLAGVSASDVDISVSGEVVTLSTERRAADLGSDAHYTRRERPHGKFTRNIQLPFRVDASRVAAQFKHGMLEITLPRNVEDRRTRIAVQAA